ncbi:MAG: beta-glucosidase [Acidobacteria bacterium]|nr:MAG: beta-glucosidase [Acidobacteriota bacterium]
MMNAVKWTLWIVSCLLLASTFGGAATPPYLNYRLPVDARVRDLVSRLTLEEKILLLSETSPALDRLGIKRYHYGNEALHGVVRPGKATVFPQAIALAVMWNPELLKTIATAISDEARAKHNDSKGVMDKRVLGGRANGLLTFWSPTINLARDPRWGRTPETYGEDPFLTSRLAVAFVRGLQGDDPRYLKVVATPKHFAANNEEHNRFECNAVISERTLREYYLPGYEAAVKEGRAHSIMSAYNAINGIPCTANRWLLTDVLRGEWGFDGYVVTDCGAISHLYDRHKFVRTPEEAAAAAINAGIDLECGSWCTIPYVFKKYLLKAREAGLVSADTIDRAVTNVLRQRFKLGMFDPPEQVPYSVLTAGTVGSPKHLELARQAARESIVLLKNGDYQGKKLLPLDLGQIKSIAVVGPKANVCEFGDYSGNPANPPVTPLDGIRRRVGARHVGWAATGQTGTPVVIPEHQLFPFGGRAGESGLRGEYFANTELAGQPSVRVDPRINFDWMNLPPDPIFTGDSFSVRWRGKLNPVLSGQYRLILTSDDGVRFRLSGRLLVDAWEAPARLDAPGSDWTPPAPRKKYESEVVLNAGQAYDVELEYRNQGKAFIRLEWLPPPVPPGGRFVREEQTARQSDVVIAFVGIGTDTGMEGLDRRTLDLPPDQELFLRKMFAANPRTVVVLINGNPLAVNWADQNVPAIVEAWYPGEQGGKAIADVLFGDYNPAGRLPLTFYRSVDQLLPFDEYEVSKGRTYLYLAGDPLYPFGFGLSYTSFEYRNLKLSTRGLEEDGRLHVSVDVKNAGDRDGEEVVQLYVRFLDSRVKRPIHALKAFRRMAIPRGATRSVPLELMARDFAYYDEAAKKFTVEPGRIEIQVGASSRDIRLRETVAIK